jgi:hypothetical protein
MEGSAPFKTIASLPVASTATQFDAHAAAQLSDSQTNNCKFSATKQKTQPQDLLLDRCGW